MGVDSYEQERVPINWEIPGIFEALCQKRGTKTKNIDWISQFFREKGSWGQKCRMGQIYKVRIDGIEAQ